MGMGMDCAKDPKASKELSEPRARSGSKKRDADEGGAPDTAIQSMHFFTAENLAVLVGATEDRLDHVAEQLERDMADRWEPKL